MKDIDKKLFNAIENNDIKTLKKCIKDGADIEARDDGVTPLMLAACNGRLECCKILINAGANIEAKHNYGWTPLMFAARDGNLDCCKILVDAGANIEAKNNHGWTPLMLAARNNCSNCCKTLIDAGADIEAKDDGGRTPLMLAACNGRSECCKILIDAGADIEVKDDDGRTPLMLAACNGRLECCKILIDAGADIEAKDKNDWTPLMCAARAGALDCCKTLIDAGAFVTLKSDEGKTALEYAIGYDHKDIIELLEPLITPERELTEHVLLNQNIENEVFDGVRVEKMPTLNPYYILSDAETNIPVGTFTPNKRLDGLEIYDGFETLDEAIDNVRNPIDTEVVDNII